MALELQLFHSSWRRNSKWRLYTGNSLAITVYGFPTLEQVCRPVIVGTLVDPIAFEWNGDLVSAMIAVSPQGREKMAYELLYLRFVKGKIQEKSIIFQLPKIMNTLWLKYFKALVHIINNQFLANLFCSIKSAFFLGWRLYTFIGNAKKQMLSNRFYLW
jgi:hypothetical protein